MKNIEELDLLNKNVVLRCDYNVPVKDNKIVDNSKIKASLKTINYLLKNNCRIVILSHFGRIKTEEDKTNNSLKIVAKELANLINKKVKFIDQPYGDEVKMIVDASPLGSIILLENTRFMDLDNKKESNNDSKLAKFFASLGDVYINDAFASMHRAHASTAGVCDYLPHAIGYGVMEELAGLELLINNTPRPFGVFMGGAKVDDKLPIIEELLKRCDCLLLGGGIANSFIKAKGQDVGKSLATDNEVILNKLKELLEKYKNKIILPVDYVTVDTAIYDIGSKTVDLYKKCIDKCSIVFVNGTPGKYEDDKYKDGTIGIFNALVSSGKTIIIGGGDTTAAAHKLGFNNKFSYVSNGGGATLEYIAYKKLAAMEWLEK